MSEDTAEVLRAEGLVKTHHGEGAPAHAVRGVDLRVARGEFVAITGPSGAGKSTLLHLLGGLQRPDAGSVWLDGVCTDGYGEARWAVERRKRIGIGHICRVSGWHVQHDRGIQHLRRTPRRHVQRERTTKFLLW